MGGGTLNWSKKNCYLIWKKKNGLFLTYFLSYITYTIKNIWKFNLQSCGATSESRAADRFSVRATATTVRNSSYPAGCFLYPMKTKMQNKKKFILALSNLKIKYSQCTNYDDSNDISFALKCWKLEEVLKKNFISAKLKQYKNGRFTQN